MNPLPFDAAKFSGIARLFPLPNLVLFPRVTQGLHIFEPRYRAMTADALSGDRLIALVLVQAGHEDELAGRPPIHSVACLGRITEDERLDDGRYNLQLHGLVRARIMEEIADGRLYRSARVEILPDVDLPGEHEDKEARKHLRRLVGSWCAADPPVAKAFARLIASEAALGVICDVLGYALPLGAAWKQDLLDTPSVDRRAAKLLGYLASTPPRPMQFPPEFSSN